MGGELEGKYFERERVGKAGIGSGSYVISKPYSQPGNDSLGLLRFVPPKSVVQIQTDPLGLLLHYLGKGKFFSGSPNLVLDAVLACQPPCSSTK